MLKNYPGSQPTETSVSPGLGTGGLISFVIPVFPIKFDGIRDYEIVVYFIQRGRSKAKTKLYHIKLKPIKRQSCN